MKGERGGMHKKSINMLIAMVKNTRWVSEVAVLMWTLMS